VTEDLTDEKWLPLDAPAFLVVTLPPPLPDVLPERPADPRRGQYVWDRGVPPERWVTVWLPDTLRVIHATEVYDGEEWITLAPDDPGRFA
jgi:hypothetical protein